MARNTPRVRDDTLEVKDERGHISVDSPQWFNWLEQHSAFSFEHARGSFTARKERRAGGFYWYAYRRQQHKLRTAYLGTSHALTLTRLNTVAQTLTSVVDIQSSRRQERGVAPHESSGTTLLLHSKLTLPRLRAELVPRPRLMRQLNEGVQRKLTLVAAPAGFGKTTLLAAWGLQSPLPVVWIALDAGDNDQLVFWDYV